jgi:NADPH-dependent glutamate synthase beta subunit-like oxidoreductase/ferredoxin
MQSRLNEMPKLVIDNRELEVDGGATILDAAGKLGIEIPTMCFLKGAMALTSCMICVVKVEGMDKLVPACGTAAEEGMRVETDCEQVRQARKAALELLLSDHVGDCMGPCQVTCPAGMDIPLMIRQIGAGRLRDAIVTVKKDIALPAVLGRICPAPCEKACRREAYDEAVSICLLKRYVADVDLESEKPWSPRCETAKKKRVAVIGAGPAGLAAAYHLAQEGYQCTILDEHEQPGGMLRYGIEPGKLPQDVLDAEIDLIFKLGVKFTGKTKVGDDLSLRDLQKDFDAVFVAIGELKDGDGEWLGLETGAKGIKTTPSTYQTNMPGIFAGGDAVRKRRLAIRSVADGKEAAVAISQYLSGKVVTGPPKSFNTRIGRLKDGEMEIFVCDVSKAGRVMPTSKDSGFTDEQAKQETARCLHCDCRKARNCKLRDYSKDYLARPGRYKADRRLFEQHTQHAEIIYEPGKCIGCGLCIQISASAGESLGLTFIGRGFDVRVAVPFDHSIAEGLKHAASQCVRACPTGALAFRQEG